MKLRSISLQESRVLRFDELSLAAAQRWYRRPLLKGGVRRGKGSRVSQSVRCRKGLAEAGASLPCGHHGGVGQHN